jgi:hypothetical protein
MRLKSLVLAGALCLAGSSFLAAKTRTFTIDRPLICGSFKLPPGTYRMRVHGETAEITDLNHFADKRPVSMPIVRQAGDQRFGHMVVLGENEGDGIYRASEVDMSHTQTVVTFQ